MPNIGGVYVPDNLMPTVQAPERPRPGFGELLGDAAKGAYAQLRYGLPLQYKTLAGELQPGDAEFYEKGLNDANANAGPGPASVSDVFAGKVGPLRAIAENLTYSVPYMAGAAVGALGGFAVGGPGGALAGGAIGGIPQFSAANVDRAVQEEGELTRAGAERSLAVAPLQSAADVAIARFLPGAGKVLGDLAVHQEGNFIRRVAVSALEGGATEAVTEAGQQVGERYAAGLPVDSADAAKEYANAAAIAFGMGGLLGAGGGFRRSPAVAKPVDAVSDADLTEHIDAMLSGDGVASTAIPRVQEEQRSLALEGGSAVEQQPGLSLASEPEITEMPPSRLPQLPGLNPALSTVPEGTQLELGQRFEDNVTPTDLPEGQAVSPETEALIAGSRPDLPNPLEASTILSRGTQSTSIEPQITTPPARLFNGEPIEDLETAIKAKNADPAVAEEAQREIARRRAEALGEAPLTTENYQTRVDELKRGLRGGFVQSVTATSPKELLEKVHEQIFDNADTRSNTAKFAQRLGLLDENLQETDLARTVAAGRVVQEADGAAALTPAPETQQRANNAANQLLSKATAPSSVTVEPGFAEEWAKIKQDAGIKRLRSGKDLTTPANLKSAQVQVFEALATDSSDAEVSQIEKLARKMGLVSDDDAMDVTPLGRQTFLQTAEGADETVKAAQLQGFTGAEASQFDSGAKAQIAGEAPAMEGDFKDLAAYQAGRVWAEGFVRDGNGVRTAAQTAAIQGRLAARQNGVPVERAVEAQRRELNPQQVQTRSLNRLLDAADMRSVSDSDQAMLRRMVRDGAPAEDVGEALQRVQGGKTLFKEAASKPVELSQPTGRGQPIFKEMNTPAAGPGKTAQRAETDAATQAYDLRGLIKFALDENGITEARAAKLQSLLDEGKVAQVKNALRAFDPDAEPVSRAKGMNRVAKAQDRRQPWGSLVGDTDPEFEQAVTGKSFMDVATYMMEHAPSPYHREVMIKVRTMAQMLERQGMTFDFRVVQPGEQGPRELNEPGTKALTHVRYHGSPSAVVYMKGAEAGPEGALNYQTAAHEMLHAVTMLLLSHGNTPGVFGKTHLGKAVAALYELQNAIADHFNARADKGDLNDFEKRFLERDNNSLQDVDELMAWGLTNPEMQRYLNTIEYKPKQSVFSRMVELIRGLFGLPVRTDGVLAELLRVSERVFATPRTELQALLPRNNPDSQIFEPMMAAVSEGAVSAQNRTVSAANEATQQAAKLIGGVAERINLSDLGVRARRMGLGWLSHNQIDRQYGPTMPALLQHSDAHRERVAVRSRFEQMGDEAYQSFEKLERANPKAAERVGQLMAMTTEFQLDPDKPWEEHTWHHAAAGDTKAAAVEAKLKSLHAQAVELSNKLRRGDGEGMTVFNDFRALNEAQNYSRMAAGLHGLVAMDPELALGVEDSLVNPVDMFMRETGLTTAGAIRDRWKDLLSKQVAAATAFVAEKKGESMQGSEQDQLAMRQHLSPIELQIGSIVEAQKAMAKAPYFHLGRFGDHFGSGVIRKLPDGTADPAAMQHVATELEKAGFDDVQISVDNSKPRFMLRFDTVDATRRFQQVALRLQEQGWLDRDEDIKAGPRTRGDNYGVQDGLPEYVSRYIQSLEASPMFVPDENMTPKERGALEQRKNDAVRLAIDTWLEQQPDSSISKVLVKRYTVPGYNKDMIRNFAHRWRVGSISLANTAAAPKFNRAYTDMRAQVNDALVAKNEGDPFLLSDLMSEMKTRDSSNPINETADTFDKLRAFGHAYFLGFSPAYGLINMTQLGVTALPELAKQHGYMKSFHAMRRAGAQAFAILKAAASEAAALGPEHYADVAITESVLRKAGLGDETRDFVTHMLATGTIDIGSAARALGQIAENRVGSKTDIALKYASAMGMYTETFSRIVTALAARELHGGTGEAVEKYATKVVSNSMFDYQNWNTARQLGKQGFAGPITPLLTQFMSYSVQITEKLYSEVMNAAAKQRPGETAEDAAQRKVEARRFLLGHLTAVTALAGTLGMPFAAVFATVIERMVDAIDDDDEPYDATASWRNFLSSVLGKDMGEVVSRGLPRAAGFDISARAGEADLLPFSQFLGDRRSWRESIEGMLGRSIGASPNMLLNIAEGGEKFSNGDVLGGMESVAPVAFKGPVKAFRMTTDGYVDSKGNKMPISPDASSYLWQLLGFSPDERAEYSEARGDQMARRGDITRQAQQLRQGILKAMLKGDQDKARELIGQAIEFDKDNPAFAVVPSLAGALSRQVQQRSRAEQLQAPLGVGQRDVAGQALTQYANIDYR